MTNNLIFTITAATPTAPAAPTGLVAIPGNAQVSLNWDDNTEPDLTGYRVYRSTTSGSGYALVSGLITASIHNDTGLANGTAYYYVVRAVDFWGNESLDSSEASATPVADTQPPLTNYLFWFTSALGIGTSGSDVVLWADQSPSGFNLQDLVGSPPTLSIAAINGRNAVNFNGATDNRLDTSGAEVSTARTLYMVANIVGWVDNVYLFGGGHFDLRQYPPDDTIYLFGLGSDPETSSSIVVPPNTWVVITAQINGSNSFVQLNQDAIGATLSEDPGSLQSEAQVGDWLDVSPNFLVAEIIGYDAVHGSSDRADIQNYLATKYAITF